MDDDDILEFERLAAKLGARLQDGDAKVADFLMIYGEPLQRVLHNAAERAKANAS